MPIIVTPLSSSATTPVGILLYNSIVASIYQYSQRPDLVQETLAAIRKATMKLHLADFWPNDSQSLQIVPVQISAGSVDYRYTIDTTQIALLRKVTSIMEYNNPLTGAERFYTQKDIDRLLDDYKLEYINYWYQAGQQVNLRTDKLLTFVTVTGYFYPNVAPTSYNSWIAQQYPDAIVEEALVTIYKNIGKVEESNALARSFEENLHMIQMAQIGGAI